MPNKKIEEATIPSKSKKKEKKPAKKATTPGKRGRPPKYSEAQKLQIEIDKYFKNCDEDKRPYTVTGLAMACGLTRQQLINYEYKEDFKPVISKAKQKVEVFLEEKLMDPGMKSVTGVIFNLKNNWGWQDKTNVVNDVSVSNDVKIIGKEGLEIEIPD